ncbi:unnamed protein product [Staurois parvus]|uniref:Spermatogenesis-associated protein 2 PUB-like domain-containing protein n=1 Tax=Staurois parvus TaxID=386267 RepID=A0ABN9FJ19_9NEOB|nr:unnamed protein product [Staurois parvus]
MAVDSLLAQYQSWLLVACTQDDAAPCADTKLIDAARRRILEEPDLHNALHNDAFSLIASGLQDQSDLLSALNRMANAFQALEQAALHLYFTPWRKEFYTIKTYSGHYVHLLEPALSQDGILLALGKLGYEPQEGGACLSLRAPPLAHMLSTAALGFLAAQFGVSHIGGHRPHLRTGAGERSRPHPGEEDVERRSCMYGEAAETHPGSRPGSQVSSHRGRTQ